MENQYEGWELDFFDQAYNFRTYQFDFIKKFIRGKTAEVGPGTGQNIDYYYKETNSVYLFEPDKRLFEQIKKKISNYPNIKFFNTEFLSTEEKFDTIMYLDVLEHIYDDERELYKAYSQLNSGGNLIINVPAFNFLYSRYDADIGHYKRYIKSDFKKLISRINPKFSKLIYYDSIGFVLIFLSKIFSISNNRNIKKKVSFWNQLIPISKIIDRLTFFSFGKTLLCIIEK